MIPRDVGLQALENKVLSWGIIGKSAPILAEITIRKSQVHFNRPGAADTLKLAFLQHPQNFDLQLRAHLTDFVEENGATMCKFKTSHTQGGGARKGPFLMPKELAFEEILRDSATVDRDERFVLAIAVVV